MAAEDPPEAPMTTRRTRRALGFAAALLVALVAAPAALAKEGVEVRLAAPISPDAEPGDTVRLFFLATALTDDGEHPLPGTSVFLRLYGPTGATTEAEGVEQRDAGTYKVLIEIPAGGAARAEFGIHGSSSNGPADVVWPYDGVLVAATIPEPVDPTLFQVPNQPGYQPAVAGNGTGPTLATGGSTTSATTQAAPIPVDPQAIGLGALVLGGLAAAAFVGLRHRRRDQPAAI
jgi:hypothetical protein